MNVATIIDLLETQRRFKEHCLSDRERQYHLGQIRAYECILKLVEEDSKRKRVLLDKKKLLDSLRKDVNEFCRLASDVDDSFSNDCLMFASALHELRRAIRKGDFDVKEGDE